MSRKQGAKVEHSRPLSRPRAPWHAKDTEHQGMAEAAQEETQAAATQLDAASQKRPPATGQPPSKKLKSVVDFGSSERIEDPTCPLVGYEVVEAGGKGACSYKSLVAALYFSTKYDLKLSEDSICKDAASLRVKTAQWLLKEERRFQAGWQPDEANPEYTRESWQEYLQKCEEPSFWIDELQLKAAAEKMKERVVVHYIDSIGLADVLILRPRDNLWSCC